MHINEDVHQHRVDTMHVPGIIAPQVKQDVYNVCDIPVRHQVWTGWPEAADDDVSTQTTFLP